METLYENKTMITKQIVFDAYKLYYRKAKKITRYLFLFLFFICLLFLGVSLLAEILSSSIMLLVLVVVSFYMFLNGHTLSTSQMYKTQIAMYPSGQMNYCFYDTYFEVVSAESKHTCQYSSISKFYSYKAVYLLSYKGAFHYVNSTGFTKGDAQEFERFISARIN